MRTLISSLLCLVAAQAQTGRSGDRLDLIVRHGTVFDGTGRPGSVADLGIRGGFIVAVGDLADRTAAVEIEARDLFVAPGFINIHSHATPDALPTAVNMLAQGVTTEIVNADGGGPLDLAQQLAGFESRGLAVNIGGYIGFNSAWQSVVGNVDRRPSADGIAKMRELIAAGLEQGAWGVSAGLDYKPGYFARTEEVIRVVEVARPWRTNFANHDRLTPETKFSSKVGIAETLTIGAEAGLVPVVTHMKIQGHEQGSAGEVIASMRSAATRGVYSAADAYPYLAGQTGLAALIVPGWAQEGGRAAMIARFADPVARGRIVVEAEQAMTARFGGPEGVYLPRTQRQLTDVMKEMGLGAGETVLRIVEQGDTGAILRFGSEADLIEILQSPTTSMACDCGASTAERVHPRFYGSYPRLLGRYVREQQVLTWEEAIRKSSALPASTIGLADRGLLAVGMAADVAVFDPRTVIDHATYDSPTLPPEGIRFVIVNGQVALSEGRATGIRAGRALRRTANLPSRAMNISAPRRLTATSTVSGRRLDIDVSQSADRSAEGRAIVEDLQSRETMTISRLGHLQTTLGWASFTGLAQVAGGNSAVTVIVDERDPASPGAVAVVILREGAPPWRVTLPRSAVSIR